MLARSLARLWTAKYFRGQSNNAYRTAHNTGPRRTQMIDSAKPVVSPGALTQTTTPKNKKQLSNTQALQAEKSITSTSHFNNSHQARQKRQSVRTSSQPHSAFAADVSSAVTTSSVQVSPITHVARELLTQLSRLSPTRSAAPSTAASCSSVTVEATRNYVAFAARRDVLGPLRHLLPAVPAHLSGPLSRAAATAGPSSATFTVTSSTATQRLRVIPSISGFSAAEVTQLVSKEKAPKPFSLPELVVFLQLYDAVGAEDGQLLLQLMGEVHRQLFAYAAAQQKRTATTASVRCSQSSYATSFKVAEEKKHEKSDEEIFGAISNTKTVSANNSNSTSVLPLPALLFTMSSLGLVEEAVLDVVTSATSSMDGSPTRRGLLYRQLPLFSTEELVTLIIALHRFGHAQQPSMKAVTKALRASLYHKATPAGAFHRTMKDVKKLLNRPAGTPRNNEELRQQLSEEITRKDNGDDGTAAGKSIVQILQTRTELASLVLEMRCPLFLLLEALTAASLTVYRRTDVVTFLSDLVAVTAVVELSLGARTEDYALRSISMAVTGKQTDTQESAIFIAHQLLRAAKLTEAMEQPQPLLSAVFAWSCTLTGKGIVVDGGEDSEVPSDRVAYYDHVTADLIKANRSD